MALAILFSITAILLIGAFLLTALSSALRRFHKRETKKHLATVGNVFFYRPIHSYFFPDIEYESLVFATICAQNMTRFCYAVLATIAVLSLSFLNWTAIILFLFLFALLGFLFGDYLPRALGTKYPDKVFLICAPLASPFLCLVFPITYFFLKFSKRISKTVYLNHLQEPSAEAKQEIIDIIQRAHLNPEINPVDKNLIESALSFRDRIAREVMVPRVNVFSLSAETSIKDAATLLISEGFSRIPIYRNTVDNVVGVLMYKDLLAKYREYEAAGNDAKILEAPIETIQKGVLYTPETKKISNLLQEFRKKQVHLAIVVDEYGGTEGIVTIEDILEEIVGDIADEYDEEERQAFRQPDGSWVVDAQMSIFDAEEQLDIRLPQDGDYDTIGGYVFHQAGAIPSKGFIIHQENFDMEIIDSNERVVEKVRIKPVHREDH